MLYYIAFLMMSKGGGGNIFKVAIYNCGRSVSRLCRTSVELSQGYVELPVPASYNLRNS